MPRKEYKKLSTMLEDVQSSLNASHSGFAIPDIITFCESPLYLGLKTFNQYKEIMTDLYPMQKIILKVFYRGSRGNEHLQLTKEEIQFCKDINLDDGSHGDVLEKYFSTPIFRDLILVWGRRSGKTFLFSIIAAYEAMKLIESPGGDPYAIYSKGSGSPISILTVATSSDQASLAFSEIKEKIINSPYFSDKYMTPEGIGADSICLLTPKDKQDNIDRQSRKIAKKKGSIIIEVGHSNSSTLRGKSIHTLLFDEMASYNVTSGPSSDVKLYQALEPAVNTFFRKVKVFDKDGNPTLDNHGNQREKKEFDGKIICISSPMGKEGVLYDLYTKSPQKHNRVSCRIPTWHVDPNLSEEDLREVSNLADEEFRQEYGAEFAGTAGSTFFPRESVEAIFDVGRGMKFLEYGQPGIAYFAHLDPASTSHNYALAVCHKQVFLNRETKTADFRVVVDHIKYWSPQAGKPILVEEVDKYLVYLKSRFFLASVTFDQWNSAGSIHKLRKAGIAAKCTKFDNKYIRAIYDELYSLVVSGKIVIPYHKLLMDEMLNLQRKPTPRGYKKEPSKTGTVKTDDLVDAIAGACFMAIQSQFNRLPKGNLVDTGTMTSSGARVWNSMSGPMGYGTGQQVSKRLERINSWPNSKR